MVWRTLVALACVCVVLAPAPARGAPLDAAPASDFNGDGYVDLAIGVPGEALAPPAVDGGAINVILGSPLGVTATGDQRWTLDTPGVRGTASKHTEFGRVMASGDFDADGHADLAIGIGVLRIAGVMTWGAVSVLRGSASGLTAAGDVLWTSEAFPGAQSGDGFGDALAAGDFNGDGYVDLAIGRPRTWRGETWSAGTVVIARGSSTGLGSAGAQVLDLTLTAPGTIPASGDEFGAGLSAGDFDGDGLDDLAIGVAGRDQESATGGIERQGAVSVVHGTPDGLVPTRDPLWSPEDFGQRDPYGTRFGSTMASGDLDGDGRDDLAVTIPSHRVETCDCSAGAVGVLYGARDGLSAARAQYWHQDSPGVPGVSEPGDEFGGALAIGDLDADGREDLAIGVPGESIRDRAALGAVTVLYGSDDGLSSSRSVVVSQGTAGVPSAPEAGDAFGARLLIGDMGRTPDADLAIGVPGEDVGRTLDAGMVNVLYGSSSGVAGAGAQGWHQGSPGVKGENAAGDGFGRGLVR